VDGSRVRKMPGERRRSRSKRSRKSRGLPAEDDAAVMAAAPAEEDADAPSDAQVAEAPAEADAPPSRPTQPAGQLQASPKARRSGLPRFVDFLTWAAGAGVTFALQSWLHHREEKRLEADERRVRRAAANRIASLLVGLQERRSAAAQQRGHHFGVLSFGVLSDATCGFRSCGARSR
jgi:hypothetical protein